MGIFDRFKKKFEDAGTDKKVRNVVDEKKKKKDQKDSKSLTRDEIKRAQAMESGKGPEATGEKKKDKKKGKLPLRDTKNAYRTLLRPIVTEKSSLLSGHNAYVFEVHPNATKPEVKKAIQAVYEITPVSVQIMNIKGKDITFGRIEGRTKDRKKAIVTLPQGKTIDVYQT